MGWASYSLRLVSILELLNSISLKYYPLLMVVQGIFLIIVGKFFKWISKNNRDSFIWITLIFSASVTFLGLGHTDFKNLIKVEPLLFAPMIFLLSSAALMAFEIVSKLKITQRTSHLTETLSFGWFILTYEVGVLLATGLNAINSHFSLIDSYSLNLIPFALVFVVLLTDFSKSQQTKKEYFKKYLKEEKVNVWRLSYFKPLLIISSLVLAIKGIQDFALMMGILGLKESGRDYYTKVYSLIFFMQTAITLSIILFNLKKKAHGPFTRRIKAYFLVQSISIFSLAFFPLPIMQILSGVGRKIQKKGLLDEAWTKLDNMVSSSVRFSVKTIYSRYAQGFGFIFLGLFSYFYIYDVVPKIFLWSAVGLLSLVGLKYLKEFLAKINGDNAERIISFHTSPAHNFYATESTLALAIPEAKNYSRILIDVYKRKPKSVLKKAIIYALGEMGNPKTIPHLQIFYECESKEQIQKAILEALLKFESYEVDHFFQKAITNLMVNPNTKNHVSEKLIKIIAKRNYHTTIMNILNIYYEHRESEENLPNILVTMGEAGRNKNDLLLLKNILPYLDSKYPLQIRQKAIIYLYGYDEFEAPVRSALNELESSRDPSTRALIGDIVSKLHLKKYLSFLENLNRVQRGSNPQVILALLQIGHIDAPKLLLKYLMNSQEADALEIITTFREVINRRNRFKFYDFVFKESPESWLKLIPLMINCKKDFGEDYLAIQDEAILLGIDVEIDFYGFRNNILHSKVA